MKSLLSTQEVPKSLECVILHGCYKIMEGCREHESELWKLQIEAGGGFINLSGLHVGHGSALQPEGLQSSCVWAKVTAWPQQLILRHPHRGCKLPGGLFWWRKCGCYIKTETLWQCRGLFILRRKNETWLACGSLWRSQQWKMKLCFRLYLFL